MLYNIYFIIEYLLHYIISNKVVIKMYVSLINRLHSYYNFLTSRSHTILIPT